MSKRMADSQQGDQQGTEQTHGATITEQAAGMKQEKAARPLSARLSASLGSRRLKQAGRL
jgi:hypothetical protein